MNVFITGGAGFLGRALLRSQWLANETVTAYSRDEHKQWRLKSELPRVRFVLGDVRDAERLVIASAGTDLIIHAAAQKFVPEGETDAIEFVRTNIEGTINVGIAAGMNRARCAILISTDKAVCPVNNYGATKMIAERCWLELGTQFKNTRFVVVRYGNVIGSTGSVVELFRKQLADTGSVRVTDVAATRFWMTVAQAVEVVKWAYDNAFANAILVPSMRAASLLDLTDAMHIYKVDCIGLRPGEKLHETIIPDHEISRVLIHSATGNMVVFSNHSSMEASNAWIGLGTPVTSDTVPRIFKENLREMIDAVRYD